MVSKLLKSVLPLAVVAPSLVAADGIIAPKDLDVKSTCKYTQQKHTRVGVTH